MFKQVMLIITIILLQSLTNLTYAQTTKIAYLVSDQRIPFWDIMSRGVTTKAHSLGHQLQIYSAQNDKKTELENIIKVIRGQVDGLIISPINSSTGTTLLKLAEQANIPVVISDIGADSENFVSYISSDNTQGAYEIGKILTSKMKQKNWQKGSIGIVAIPQERLNGQRRTAGFLKAIEEDNFNSAGILQQVNFSYQETYQHSTTLIKQNPDLKAIWLQGSDRYQAALDAISDNGKKDQILLVCFDAEPIFLDLIPEGVITGAAMQQPFLMGEKAVTSLHQHLQGEKVTKKQLLPVLAISSNNIDQNLAIIKRNVLGQ